MLSFRLEFMLWDWLGIDQTIQRQNGQRPRRQRRSRQPNTNWSPRGVTIATFGATLGPDQGSDDVSRSLSQDRRRPD